MQEINYSYKQGGIDMELTQQELYNLYSLCKNPKIRDYIDSNLQDRLIEAWECYAEMNLDAVLDGTSEIAKDILVKILNQVAMQYYMTEHTDIDFINLIVGLEKSIED